MVREKDLNFARRLLRDHSLLSVRSALKRQAKMIRAYASLGQWQPLHTRPAGAEILVGAWEWVKEDEGKMSSKAFRVFHVRTRANKVILWPPVRIGQATFVRRLVGWMLVPAPPRDPV